MDADKASVEAYLPKEDRGEEPGRSVVLIDEIDKTSRDFPNDLLNEVEHARFQIQETGDEFIADRALRPILIITSNSEKSLPDPFLRRCLFHHISPPTAEMLREIVKVRLGVGESELLDHAITWFVANRESFKKEPSTGEFLHWARVLHNLQIDPANLKAGESEILAVSYAALAKNEDDVLKLIPQKKL